jgi:hypothetical protein
MTMSKITRNLAVALVGLLATTWSVRAALADDFVIIHNAKTGARSLTKTDLKNMAIGRKKAWESGVPVQLVLSPVGAPEMKWFSLFATGISEETLAAKMKQEIFKGELRRPVIVSSDRDCVNAVAADPGGVGVVSAAAAKSLPAGVMVLAVQ